MLALTLLAASTTTVTAAGLTSPNMQARHMLMKIAIRHKGVADNRDEEALKRHHLTAQDVSAGMESSMIQGDRRFSAEARAVLTEATAEGGAAAALRQPTGSGGSSVNGMLGEGRVDLARYPDPADPAAAPTLRQWLHRANDVWNAATQECLARTAVDSVERMLQTPQERLQAAIDSLEGDGSDRALLMRYQLRTSLRDVQRQAAGVLTAGSLAALELRGGPLGYRDQYPWRAAPAQARATPSEVSTAAPPTEAGAASVFSLAAPPSALAAAATGEARQTGAQTCNIDRPAAGAQ